MSLSEKHKTCFSVNPHLLRMRYRQLPICISSVNVKPRFFILLMVKVRQQPTHLYLHKEKECRNNNIPHIAQKMIKKKNSSHTTGLPHTHWSSIITHTEHTEAPNASGSTWLIPQLLPTFNPLLCDSRPVSQYKCVTVKKLTALFFSLHSSVAFVWQAAPHLSLFASSSV